MEIGPILLIAMIVLIIGLCVWFYFNNKKPEPVQQDIPVEPDVPVTPVDPVEPDTPDVPDSSTDNIPNEPGVPDSSIEPDVPDEPVEPIEPDTPDTPDVPEIPIPDSSVDPDVPDEPNIPVTPVEPNTPDVPVEPDVPKPNFDEIITPILDKFSKDVNIKKGMLTYDYLIEILKEVYYQYYNGKSEHGLPILLKEENFPNIYNFYGDNGDEESAFKTAVGWCFALVLSELKPTNRTHIFKTGYKLGGYNKYSNIYRYKFEFDPNVMRIFSAVIYVAMRGKVRPDMNSMRKELGTSKYSKTLNQLNDTNKEQVGTNDFFIDFREFMPTAPGPYAPGYTTRPDDTYPNEKKDEYKNISVDRNIYEMVIKKYNLNVQDYYQDTVQAIADKEADVEHLFGDDITAGVYHFSPVFGEKTIGIRIDPESNLSKLVDDSLYASSRARSIMQSANVNPKQYGRLRPGCSWTQEATKHSNTDDRYNVLANFIIEDGDGHQTGYYDKNGNWIHPESVKSAQEYEDLQKRSLWANSYPSGHSSGICGGSMVLIEKMPDKSDLILREMNRFAINRTIARYHWTSDTINGRVLGSAQNAVAHAASDYDDRLNKC